MSKNVLIYVRVSTAEQAEKGYSIGEQIDKLTAFCKTMEWTIVKIYDDGGYSGANTDRPALKEMLKDIEKGIGDTVLVYKLDRLSRSQKDTLKLLEEHFFKHGVNFLSLTENFDTSTPFGKATIGILAVFAQLEREQIKERMNLGKVGRAKAGKYKGGGWIPIGYDYINGELIVNEFEAMQVRKAFELLLDGKSIMSIARYLNDKGFTHKHGEWFAYSVRRVLQHDLYLGIINYCGKKYQGTHTPIIDEESFKRAQEILEINRKKSVKHVEGGSSYLSGIIYCKRCGARYYHGNYRVKQNGKTYHYEYYNCYSRRKFNTVMVRDKSCKNDNWKVHELDNLVFEEIRKLAKDPELITEIKEENFSEDDSLKVKQISKEIEKLSGQKSRLMDLYSLGEFDVVELQDKVNGINKKREKLQEELEELTKNENTMSESEVLKIVDSFDDVLKEGTMEEVRLLILSLIDRIEIDGKDIDIYWRFA